MHWMRGGRGTWLTGIALAAALAAVGAIAGCGGSGDAPIQPRSAAEVNQLLDGIPQQGLALGEPGAQVTAIEFGDLQCSACRKYAEEVLPPIVENQVRSGEAKLSFSPYAASDPESIAAAAAAIAAGEQGRGWNFVEVFYLSQRPEHPGYVTDDFLATIAKRAGVADLARWNRERKGKRVAILVESATAKAASLGSHDSPTFAVLGPSNYDEFREPVKNTGSPKPLEAAISDAAVNPYQEEQ